MVNGEKAPETTITKKKILDSRGKKLKVGSYVRVEPTFKEYKMTHYWGVVLEIDDKAEFAKIKDDRRDFIRMAKLSEIFTIRWSGKKPIKGPSHWYTKNEQIQTTKRESEK